MSCFNERPTAPEAVFHFPASASPKREKEPRMNERTHYISTAIPYVNAEPHVGFALELAQADAIARQSRLCGRTVFLQGGTDDNSLKNVKAAEAAGLATSDFVEGNARRFRDLAAALGVEFDGFVSTSRHSRHAEVVSRLWRACEASGDLYRKSYEGLYCAGCEQFYAEAELVGGCCSEHGTRPETVREENWFFRLSRHRDRLLDLVESDALRVVPASKRNEVLATLRAGLDDISVSRPASRSRGWGIGVPGDPDQVVYVWFDALANYLTGAGFCGDGDAFEKNWVCAAEREHVVGKGITRFHAVYWPAILLSAGLPLPTKLTVHGYLTAEGKKIGKSSNNAVSASSIVSKFGRDAVRWYLLRHIRCDGDGDFSEARLVEAHDADLADQLGNLVSRILPLLAKRRALPHPATAWEGGEFSRATSALASRVAAGFARFEIHEAARAIIEHCGLANRYVVAKAPWTALKTAGSDEAARLEVDKALGELLEALFVIADCLEPFVPDGAARLRGTLGRAVAGSDERAVLFPKIAAIVDKPAR
jgi:methionyl-tRNA synthetase